MLENIEVLTVISGSKLQAELIIKFYIDLIEPVVLAATDNLEL
jgi:hypothetical protein